MAVVVSMGAVETVGGPSTMVGGVGDGGALGFYDDWARDYAAIYATQPNVRVCVDFLARNVAHLACGVFRRRERDNADRLDDHPLALLLARPNFWTTRHRLFEAVMQDLGVWHNAYWLKVRSRREGLQLVRIPPSAVQVQGGLAPTNYRVMRATGGPLDVPPSELVHLRASSPTSPIRGLSPLETLRRVLAEDDAAGQYREQLWRNSARMSGVITRPLQAPRWEWETREKFRQEFAALYSGAQATGSTAILEEGMQWQQITFTAQEAQYLEARKIAREEAARAFHIPPPMVGILDHATFSNITEQHKMVYQDTLGPWLDLLAGDIELQLLTEWEASPAAAGLYVAFDLDAKLAGDFETRAASLQTLVGRPIMTADEGRAKLGLPALGGVAAELVTPLNVLVGGQASPTDSAPPLPGALALPPARSGAKAWSHPITFEKADPTGPRLRERHAEKWEEVMRGYFERQGRVVADLADPDTGPGVATPQKIVETLREARWNRELGRDLLALNRATAEAFGKRAADVLGTEFDAERMAEWLAENAGITAELINAKTADHVENAVAEGVEAGTLRQLFETAATARAAQVARSRVTSVANFGQHEAAEQGGAKLKTWTVNSGNPRGSHSRLGGQTVALAERFSNGLLYPGDYSGSAEETAGCTCSLAYS